MNWTIFACVVGTFAGIGALVAIGSILAALDLEEYVGRGILAIVLVAITAVCFGLAA